ncbi:hypothetical protein [Couchioplanes caeruleus]|nr:hypothetical protein [Couchioplanes caeruleus]
MSSRKVALSAAFLALAAGGTAACDASSDDDLDSWGSAYSSDSGGYSADSGGGSSNVGNSRSGGASSSGANSSTAGSSSDLSSSDGSDSGVDGSDSDDSGSGDGSDGSGYDEVFYCADESGEVVDEENCDDPSSSSPYFLWHSPNYVRGLPLGTYLDGGDYFPAGDRTARRSFNLPVTGKVGNGTVKTNVVGRGSGGSGMSTGISGG